MQTNKHLYYIRHGETTANVDKICAGHTDVALTDNGRKQAELAGLAIKKEGIHFDLIISSPLQRAIETAQIIANEIDYTSEIVIDDTFIERFRGELEGKPVSKQAGMTDEEFLSCGAEGNESLIHRAKVAVEHIKNLQAQNILVVGHNSFGKYFISAAESRDVTTIEKIPNATLMKVLL